MPVPCDCCPVAAPPRCALTSVRFDSVAQTVAEAGWGPVNLGLTIDGVTATNAQSGYNTGVPGPSTTLRVTYGLAVPHSRVRGVRIWGQGGGDLSDADGPASWISEFYAGATLLSSLPSLGANGPNPVTTLLPGGAELTGVTSVVMRTIAKLNPGAGVAPLWREFQLIELDPAFPCRRRSGVTEWYDITGALVPQANLIPC